MLKVELQSYMDVVDIAQNGFNTYLKAINFPVLVNVKQPASEKTLTQQQNGVLLIYKLIKRQPGSMKQPFQERTYLRPFFVNSQSEPSGLAVTNSFEFRLDNLIEFQFYSTDYKRCQECQEQFINYMQISWDLYRQKGIQLPIFWEQLEDDIVDIGNTKTYCIKLRYQAQTQQKIQTSTDVIRKINLYLDTQL